MLDSGFLSLGAIAQVDPAKNPQANQNITMSDTYVPMISSGTAGPLGVVHLPRLWQKVSLEAAGKIHSGDPGIGRGLDVMTSAAPRLGGKGGKEYIKKKKKNQIRFE